MPTPLFFRQMAAVVEKELPLVPALRSLSRGFKGTRSRALREVARRVESGTGLGESMGSFPAVFKPHLVEIVKAGEGMGAADEALARCAELLESETVHRRRLQAAMVYPVLVLGLAVLGGSYLALGVLPGIVSVLETQNIPLPGSTRALMRFVGSIQEFSTVLAWSIPLALIAGGAFMRTETGRAVRDRVLCSLPFTGSVARSVAAGHFARALGQGLRAGLPLSDAMEMAGSAAGNRVIRGRVKSATSLVLAGGSLEASLRKAGLFSPRAGFSPHVNESTGTLEDVLGEISEDHERAAAHSVRMGLSLLEPILLLVAAGAVGFLVVSLALPIYLMMGYV